ncbi:hypothetical protein JJD41_20070 [Oxynema sp. CENA135]|nr:hypothetical protein [Oxynema sp. CENA135]
MTFLKLKTIPKNRLFLQFKSFFHPDNSKQLNWALSPNLRVNWATVVLLEMQLQQAFSTGSARRSRSPKNHPASERLGLIFAALERENTLIF